MTIGLFRSRLKDGGELAPFEYAEMYGLLLYYKKDAVVNNHDIYQNFETKEIKDEIKFHYLNCRYLNSISEDTDIEELKRLKLTQFKKRIPIVINEIQKNGLQVNKLQDLESNQFHKAFVLLSIVDDKLILPYPKPIWCDFERLAHIYLGHTKELFIGENNTRNTFFQYSFKELRSVLKNILHIIYDEFIAEIKATNKTFVRRGSRAIEFDGHYYRVEIETSGRLIVFHPYNDNSSKENDN